jgi:hypothetical protein
LFQRLANGRGPYRRPPCRSRQRGLAKALDQSLGWSHEAMDRQSLFIPALHVAAVELEWASSVVWGSEVRVISAASRNVDFGTGPPASLMAAWGNPDMRVLLAWLIVLGAFAGSATAFAIWGSRKVAADVRIETSCMLLDAAEKEGWISRSARFDLMQKVATSSKTNPAVRDAADRMRSGCPGRKVP